MRHERELECIAGMDGRSFERSCREFKDGVGTKAARQTPGAHAASHFSDNIPPIKEDEVDGKLHADGMHCLTRHDPQAVAFSQ